MSKLSHSLYMLRMRNNKLQREVSAETGIPRTKISQYETGTTVPTYRRLTQLMDYYHAKAQGKYNRNEIEDYWEEEKSKLKCCHGRF